MDIDKDMLFQIIETELGIRPYMLTQHYDVKSDDFIETTEENPMPTDAKDYDEMLSRFVEFYNKINDVSTNLAVAKNKLQDLIDKSIANEG